ncbi:eCIS core domain-containing protein [Plantactinospora endophytica]|uniref:eCIS core domain-containing protein n=1 Tax=Plantactinospora endophytica TaxID=673535 RepID=A0ABQ4E7D3_9ACTN|nr:DUF4157 domain-containing protein [Plantactinospora endophytica]GIG90627.1 hypothetical protein Pen02_55630 [Plantactinospora endophytica]
MRAHDPPDRDAPTRRGRQTRAGAGGAAPTGSTAAILALQQQAGNAAVTWAIQRLHAESGPEHGHTHDEHGSEPAPGPEPVQRSAVHEVLRSAGTPLAEPVRQDAEARLGADFSDVRLHTGSLAQRSADEVGARAYTSGQHVVLGQGGADRRTLLHELTHVIQQRSGPVSGTDDGLGHRVSDPGDSFERAAEANAQRALGAPPAAAHPHGVLGAPPARREAHTATEPAGASSDTPAVQRVTQDELHREPPGPSVRVRGPRRSASTHKPTAKVRNQDDWNQLSAAYQAATGQAPVKDRISLDTDFVSVNETSPPVPAYQLGNALRQVATQERIPATVGGHTRSNAEMMEELGRRDPVSLAYWQAQDARDQQLANDAVARATQYQQESGDDNASAVADVTAAMLRGVPMPAADATDMLLLANDGLVIGGPHHQEPFFAWAANHMARLHQNGVRTLYLESVREDAHQRLIDAYLASGVMSPELTNFCDRYRAQHAVDLAEFLTEAHSTGMRIKGTGGRPARSVGTNMHRRAVMQNTYGEQVIRRDRAQSVAHGTAPGKYLVQAGASHATTHNNAQPGAVSVGGVNLPNHFPGINELLEVPAVRLADDPNVAPAAKVLRPI